jgi:dTDP-4-amino-4,6-dideoxygalactose transaminase
MSERRLSRRNFLVAAPAAGVAVAAKPGASTEKPALLGGKPACSKRFSWPVWDQTEEQALLDVVRSGHWYRGTGKNVAKFEQAYAQLTGAKHCIGTSSGTGALLTSLAAVGVGAGDEVILPPYTFVATVNVILSHHALPVFVDSDIETAQIDPGKIEAKISDRTAAIMPVHLGGAAADLDRILPIGQKRKIPVIEDACQSHLGEWRGRKVGTYGAAGCYSFQATKNLNCGEGGAILTNDDDVYERCFAYHWNGQGRRTAHGDYSDLIAGTKLLMTEFQAAMLIAQMTRLERQAKARDENAAYLTSLLREIPGVTPVRMYEGCTRNAYHGYIFRFLPEQFGGNLTRAQFIRAMNAEGVPCGAGYVPLNKRKYIQNTLQSRGYRRLFPKAVLDSWLEKNQCPANDQLCKEAIWVMQEMFVGPRSDMEMFADAVRKIKANAAELARA